MPAQILGPDGDGVHAYNDLDDAGLTATCEGTVYASGLFSRNVFRVGSGEGPEQIVGFPLASAFPSESPWDLALDAAENLYVATSDAVRGRVLRRTPQGDLSEALGPEGGGADPLRLAERLGVDAADRVFVLDRGAMPPASGASGNVFRLDEGAVERVLGSDAPAFGTARVAADAAGNAYVTGVDSDNVFRVSPAGEVEQILSAAGDGIHGLDGPDGIATDPDGNVYVVGSLSDNAFRVTPEGVVTQILGPEGDGANALEHPVAVAAGTDGIVYVGAASTQPLALPTSDNVFRIAPGGAIAEIFRADSLRAPLRALAIDADGNLFAAFRGRLGVVRDDSLWRLAPGPPERLLDPNDAPGALDGVNGVATDTAGNVYVAAQFSDTVYRLVPEAHATAAALAALSALASLARLRRERS